MSLVFMECNGYIEDVEVIIETDEVVGLDFMAAYKQCICISCFYLYGGCFCY